MCIISTVEARTDKGAAGCPSSSDHLSTPSSRLRERAGVRVLFSILLIMLQTTKPTFGRPRFARTFEKVVHADGDVRVLKKRRQARVPAHHLRATTSLLPRLLAGEGRGEGSISANQRSLGADRRAVTAVDAILSVMRESVVSAHDTAVDTALDAFPAADAA